MKKSKIIVDNHVIDLITNSVILDDNSKISFLRYVGYMKKEEREELIKLI